MAWSFNPFVLSFAALLLASQIEYVFRKTSKHGLSLCGGVCIAAILLIAHCFVSEDNAVIALFVWWEVVVTAREGWKCVQEESGERFVVIHGTKMMLRWSANK